MSSWQTWKPAGRSASRISQRSVTTTSASHAKLARVITSTKMPWPGNPRVNIQNEKGKAKRYQVRQVLAAIAKLKEMVEAKER